MKILHIIDSEGIYGAEVMLLNLAAEQKEIGHTPVIASIREKDESLTPLEMEANRRGIDAVTFRMLDGPNFIGSWRILRYAQANGFEILHCHGYKGNILFGFIPRKVRRIPLVSTIHGWTSVRKISKLRLYELIDALSLKFIDTVCVVSRAMLERPILKNLKGKVHVIPNGIPLLFCPDSLPENGIAEYCRQGFTIVSIGRLSVEKGYTHLIKAFAEFLDEKPDAYLLIIGEGPERMELETIVRNLGLAGRVLLPGYCENAWRYLYLCKVFVLSSMTEGLPITLLEAMQTKIPVVATAVGGVPEIITNGDTGRLVSTGDPGDICRALKSIHEDYSMAAAMADRAGKLAEDRYTSASMAREYDLVYSELKATL